MNVETPAARLAAWLCREYALTPPVDLAELHRVCRARRIRIKIEPQLKDPAGYIGGGVGAIALQPGAEARHLAHELGHALADYSRRGGGELANVVGERETDFVPDPKQWEHHLCMEFAAILCGEAPEEPMPEPILPDEGTEPVAEEWLPPGNPPQPRAGPAIALERSPRAYFQEEIAFLAVEHGPEVVGLGRRLSVAVETFADAREALGCFRQAFAGGE